MDQWEYTEIDLFGAKLEGINKLGREGWEAITAMYGSNAFILMKRKVN